MLVIMKVRKKKNKEEVKSKKNKVKTKNTKVKEKNIEEEVNLNKKKKRKKDTIDNKEGKKKKKKRRLWKILLTLFIIGCTLCIFAVFAFCLYIVTTTGEFDPNALANQDRTIIYDIEGNEIATLGMENRETINYDKLPEVLIDAIIATEDSRFFQHNGVDAARFIKAAVKQVLGDSSAGGASTLTMQVVKNNLTSTDKDIIRKFRDVYLAVFFMEKKYTKEEILTFYVNDSTLGGGTYGVEEASKYYFGKSVSDLTLPEAALIAGLFQAPNGYNPYYYPEAATARRSTVLKLMVRHGYITQEEADIANSISVESMLVGLNEEEDQYKSYIETVVEEVENKTGDSPYLVSMKIYTNMVPSIQTGLSDIMAGNSSYRWIDNVVQAGVTVVDVKTGAVAAVGGGRNRNVARGLNYATQVYRQPGSTAKPVFAYGPGFEYNNFSTYELFNDEEWHYSDGTPLGNWDGGYEGLITLKRAVAVSRNIPAVKAFQRVGSKNVVKFVQGLGIDLNDVAYEAYSIGGLDPGVSTLEMAGAYAAFANGGYYTEPYTVSKIVYRETGDEVDLVPETNRAMKDSTAYLVTNVLEYAANYGFNGGTSSYAGTVAVKTGTSNYTQKTLDDYNLPYNAVNDLWSVAYTPEYSIALWYGYDEISSTYYSSKSSLKDDLMKEVMKHIPVCKDAFKIPSSVVASKVEFGTWPAQLPSEYTPSDLIMTEYFVKGTQPTEESSRFAKLKDVSDLKVTTSNGSVSLSWTGVEPEVISEDYLETYFSQSIFGNGTSKLLAERLSYNKDTLGGFGYGIYQKGEDGELDQIGFTTSNNFNFKTETTGSITLVVKSQYKSFTVNASDGVVSKTTIIGTIGDKELSLELNGEEKVVLEDGAIYKEEGINVFYDNDNISNNKRCKITYSLNSSAGQDGYATIEELEQAINKLEPGNYEIKYLVNYNGQNKNISREIEIKEKAQN